MPRQIALLRGINVGGHRKVPMAELRALAEGLGHEAVKTYVQSGNLVSTVPKRSEKAAVEELEQAIEETFGFPVAVVVRTRDELAEIAAADPLAGLATEPKHHHVLFLGQAPAADRLEKIDVSSAPEDTLVVRGREIYLWTPGGIHDSKLARMLTDKRLGTTVTARNWRTVETLLALADA